jgi:hypothetical protein
MQGLDFPLPKGKIDVNTLNKGQSGVLSQIFKPNG